MKNQCKTCNTITEEGELIEIRKEISVFICDTCLKAILGDTEE